MQHPLPVTLDAARLASETARCLYRWRLAPQKFGLASTTRYRIATLKICSRSASWRREMDSNQRYASPYLPRSQRRPYHQKPALSAFCTLFEVRPLFWRGRRTPILRCAGRFHGRRTIGATRDSISEHAALAYTSDDSTWFAPP